MALHQRAAEVGDWAQRVQAIGVALVWLLPAPVVTAAIAWLNSGSVKQTASYTAVAFLVSGIVVRFRPRAAETPKPLPVPAPDSTLAMLRDMGFRFDHPVTDPNPPQLTWHQLEGRFKNIPGEVEAMWRQEDGSGAISWWVYSRVPEGPRVVARFLNEARIAGRLLATMPTIPRKFAGQHFEDYADDWLNVVAAVVGPEPRITGTGGDEQGTYQSALLENMNDASQVACGRLASAAITGMPVLPQQARTLTNQIAALRPYEKAAHDLKTLAQEQTDRLQQLVQGQAASSTSEPPDTEELQTGLVQLSWHQEPAALHIDALNTSAETIREFKLFVTDVRKYHREHKQFVEVPDFHQHGPFQELQLWSDTGTQGTPVGGVTKLFSGSAVTFALLYRDATQIWFRGRTGDASVEQRIIREAGTWQVSLRCEVAGRRREERLVFEWHDIGRAPRPQVVPSLPFKPMSDASPAPTVLGTRASAPVPLREASSPPDPNGKHQAFADVLTDRYSFALHGIMNWERLGKGQEFTEADAREWDEMERKWTDEVRDLLKAHGCNAQIQAHFRDLHEVPYNQFHHFRYMSERLSMFSLRLKRLKSIINHYAIVPILE